MLILLVPLPLGAAGYTLRYRALQREIVELEENKKKVEGALERLERPRPKEIAEIKENLKALDREQESLQAQLGRAEAIVSHLEQTFAPADDSRATRELELELFRLANESGILVREFVPYRSEAAGSTVQERGTTVLDACVESVPRERRVAKLVLFASFAALREFIHGLKGLKWRVTPVKMDIQRHGPPLTEEDPGKTISATLILVL